MRKQLHVALAWGILTTCSAMAEVWKDENSGILWEFQVSDGCVNVRGACYPDSRRALSGELVIPAVLGEYSVTGIGAMAFDGCAELTRISIPEGVTNIGAYAFMGCSGLTCLAIPESVISIGYQAFAGCSELASITIPTAVKNIDVSAFFNCYRLKEFVVQDGNADFSAKDGLLTSKDGTILLRGVGGDVKIPFGVKIVAKYAFYRSGLTSVMIPQSVQIIEDEAFASCAITTVEIPESVTAINGTAFSYCRTLTQIVVNENNSTHINPFDGEPDCRRSVCRMSWFG